MTLTFGLKIKLNFPSMIAIRDCHWCKTRCQLDKTRNYFTNNFFPCSQMNRWKKKGLSVMPMKYGIGWNGGNYNVYMTIYHVDGTVAIAHGGIESGQGINTKVFEGRLSEMFKNTEF